MNEEPVVSVIVPFYNHVPWAVEAVRSVLDGAYENFEILLVDDGSTEDVTPLRSLDERVRYVRQENRGPAAARNLGLSLARGRYVAFLDSDDLFEPEKLERQVAVMEKRPDVAISHTSYQLVDAGGESIGEVRSGRYSGWVYPRIYADAHSIATPTVMVRREALDSTAEFKENLRYGEDTLFWIHMAKGSELLGMDEPLSRVRVHGGNAYLDLRATKEGLENVVRYGVAKDEILRSTERRKLLCSLYFTVAIMNLEHRNKAGFLCFALRALLAWPFDRRVYASLGSLLKRNAARGLGHVARRLYSGRKDVG